MGVSVLVSKNGIFQILVFGRWYAVVPYFDIDVSEQQAACIFGAEEIKAKSQLSEQGEDVVGLYGRVAGSGTNQSHGKERGDVWLATSLATACTV